MQGSGRGSRAHNLHEDLEDLVENRGVREGAGSSLAVEGLEP